MKKLLLPIAALTPVLFSSDAFAQEPTPLSINKVRLRADALVLFAPAGWKIERTVSGDLNRDKTPDAALILVENKPVKDKDGYPTARQRALVVAVREGKGWHRLGFSGTILQGTRDGGAFYGVVETPVGVTIRKGVLNVEQDSGSREVSERTHRFRLDRRTQRFYLIGSELIERDRATSEVRNVSTNYLTGIQKATTIRASGHHTSVGTARFSKRLRTLESMTEEQRYTP
jgi:hypothetical protein